MKKKLFVALISLLLPLSAFAGGFGVIGGYTSSKIKLSETTFKTSNGVHAGVAYNLPLGAGFAFQPELIYNVKGYNWGEEGTSIKDKAKFGYVELPLQLQWGVDLVLLRPYVFAEPFVGYAVWGNKLLSKSRFEYGLGVGAGTDLFDFLQLSFKYYWNFEDASQWADVTGKVKGGGFNGLLFTVGFFF